MEFPGLRVIHDLVSVACHSVNWHDLLDNVVLMKITALSLKC